jgi:hypothetical protein
MGKREKSFNNKVEKVEKIVRGLSEEYYNLPEKERYGYGLSSRISAKVQLELCVSLRKAQEYVRLVQIKQKCF